METFRGIRRVLWITLGLNLIPTAAKLTVGYSTGSLSIIADGFDSVFDSASNLIGLVGIYMAARPADEDHPYGHRKAETLAALVISSLLFLTTWELVRSSIVRLRNPALIQTRANIWSFAALVVSIAVHLGVVWYETREGRRLRSDVLIADAKHTRADVFVSLAVMGGLVAVRFGYPIADPILALVVAAFIAKIGIDIVRETSPTLMDGVAMPRDEVEQIAMAVPGIISCHRVRSRGHEQAVYADLHVQVDPAMSTAQAHAIAHEVQDRLRQRRPDIQDVTIHVEPAGALPQQAGQEQIAVQLRRLADGLGVAVHDVWAYHLSDGYYAETHLEADGAIPLQQAHRLASALEQRSRAEIPNLVELTTHMEPRGRLIGTPGPGLHDAQVAAMVQEVADETGETEACHGVQVRQGASGWAISLHCQLSGEMSLAEAHRVSARLEGRLRERIPGVERVVIHTEPREESPQGLA